MKTFLSMNLLWPVAVLHTEYYSVQLASQVLVHGAGADSLETFLPLHCQISPSSFQLGNQHA